MYVYMGSHWKCPMPLFKKSSNQADQPVIACTMSCLLLQAPGSMGAAGSAAAPPPQQPSGPPAHITMATADVSKVPAEQKPVLGSLNNLFNFCMQAANTPGTAARTCSWAAGARVHLTRGQRTRYQPFGFRLLQLCCAVADSTMGHWPSVLHCLLPYPPCIHSPCLFCKPLTPFPLLLCAAKKREMDDNSRRIGSLFWKLNEGQVAPHVLQKLMHLCAALDAGNWPAAAHIQVGADSLYYLCS